MYSLRFDKPSDGNYKPLIKVLKQRSTKFFTCVEKPDTDHEHTHSYVESKFSISTLRKDVQKILLSKGNAAYSLKSCKDSYEKAQCYTAKGTDKNVKEFKIIAKKGFTTKDIDQFNKNYWIVNAKAKKKHQTKGKPLYIQIYTEYQSEIDSKISELEAIGISAFQKNFNNEFIKKKCIQYYVTKFKSFPNPIQITNMALSILALSLQNLTKNMTSTVDVIYQIMYKKDLKVNALEYASKLL